jgi:uncharacterized protein (DUF952 family)
MEPIVIIARQSAWQDAKHKGIYAWSTIDSELKSDGFIHAANVNQALAIAARKYSKTKDLVLLFVDPKKLTTPLKYESTNSSPDSFPHIYGPVNTNAIYKVVPLMQKGSGFEVGTPVRL